jgi:hypothetical protein
MAPCPAQSRQCPEPDNLHAVNLAASPAFSRPYPALAGDDVSWTPAWAEGAVQTSLNAVWGIMHHLGGWTHPGNPGPGDVFAGIGPIELPD